MGTRLDFPDDTEWIVLNPIRGPGPWDFGNSATLVAAWCEEQSIDYEIRWWTKRSNLANSNRWFVSIVSDHCPAIRFFNATDAVLFKLTWF
jgi:hypothetical protein